ncbi:MAG TPA: hypothetical protein VGA20_09155 [Gemmatimonadales bacterium]
MTSLKRRRTGLACTLVIALGACGQERSQRAPRDSGRVEIAATPVAATPPAQDTAFTGTTAVTDKRRAGPPALLRAVSFVSSSGYDRIVFEFAGDSVPGYHVEYPTRPVVRCGSGDPVTVAGQARLLVRLAPARAHDDGGNVSIAERESAPGLPAVKEMKLVCDFEGQVEWVLGVAAMRPYRVVEADGPPRLVLDVSHAP